MIKGIGVDIVETKRIGGMLKKHGAHFTGRIFTQSELAYARGRKRRVEHLAARFAAKEALAKAVGMGMTEGVSWQDIEVVHGPQGDPRLKLGGKVARLARRLGISGLHLTLTHTDEYAVAVVVAEGPTRRRGT